MKNFVNRLDSNVVDVYFSKSALRLILPDGREISVPLEWFPTLRDATDEERNDWHLIGNGIGVHCPQIDEDVSLKSLMKN